MQWEYRTLLYGTPERGMRRWAISPADPRASSQQVGEAERSRFVGQAWQAMRLLETALKELDADGWELVSASTFAILFSVFGTAVLRRPAAKPE